MFVLLYRKRMNRWLILSLLFCSIAVYTSYNAIGLWLIMPLIFVYYLITTSWICAYRDNVLYALLLLLSLFSCFVSDNVLSCLGSFYYLLTGFVGFIIFEKTSENVNNIKWLFVVYILYYVGMWWYIINDLGIGEVNIATDRLGTEGGQLNANDVAYMTFYFNAAFWMLYSLSPKVYKNRIIGAVLLILMIVVSFISAILFASRQILILELPFILGVFYIRFLRGNKGLKKIFVFVSGVTFLIMLYQYVGKDVFSNSLLFTRFEGVEEDSRIFLLQKALDVGFHNPILGVGCGNFMNYANISVFSHCSYTELFANSGIFAAMIYITWIIHAIRIQIRRYKITKNVIFLYFALICLIWFFANFFFVYYINIWLMGFWGILLGSSRSLYQQELCKCVYHG